MIKYFYLQNFSEVLFVANKIEKIIVTATIIYPYTKLNNHNG